MKKAYARVRDVVQQTWIPLLTLRVTILMLVRSLLCLRERIGEVFHQDLFL